MIELIEAVNEKRSLGLTINFLKICYSDQTANQKRLVANVNTP